MDTINAWLYRGGHPNRVAAVLNRMWATVWGAGLSPKEWSALEVRGRRTGRRISFPVVLVDHGGARYLVSMLGERASWVANVRADGGRATLVHGGREAVRLEEVPPSDRAPILKRYLELAPGARAHMPVDRHAPLAAFEEIADRYPVFRIQPEPAAPSEQPATPSTR